MQIHRLRLYLGWDLTHRPADSFPDCMVPVETGTGPFPESLYYVSMDLTNSYY